MAGSRVSGAIFFGIQLQDAAEVEGVQLYVGGELVTPTFPGENTLRVFVIPRDHPEGPLELRAVVRSGGVDRQSRIQVQVVHAPPSSGIVAASGAILGDAEASGAISTVSIPAGVATGASISFETMTQAQVLAATGVDYDALGVTFLGAQEIRSTIPTGDRVAMTSGGFGPMVQPGQTVVSYRIGPDMGRGVGELMVIGGASVAPNGDVVSNPPVVPQAADATLSSALGTRSLALHGAGLRPASTLPAGPPGSLIEVAATGLNIYAVHGYYVRFRVGATTAEVPATVGLNADGRQYLLAVVPPLPTGAATVELVWKVGDTVIASYAMTITTPQPFSGSAKAIVDANYVALRTAIDQADVQFQAEGMSLPFEPIRQLITTARADYASRADDDPELLALARSLWNGGATLSSNSAGVRPSQNSATCLLNGFKFINDKQFAERAFRGDRYETGFRGLQGDLSLGYLNRFADRLDGFDEYDCDPYKDVLCEALGNCGPEDIATDPWFDESPNSPWPRPSREPPSSSPPNWVTGMGSVVVPGGPAGGTFIPDDFPEWWEHGSLSAPAQASVPRIQAGRYTVTALYNGQPLPFAGFVQEDGYFFLPTLPEGSGSQLAFTDRQTWRNCVLPVSGRPVGSATVLQVAFASCADEGVDPGEYTIEWVGGASSLWGNAQNWDPPRLPNADDDVLIPGVATYVTLPSGGFHYDPVAVVAVRSLRSQGVVALGHTVLQASGDVILNVLRVEGSGTTEVDAGGTFSYDALHVWKSPPGFTLPDEPVTLASVVVAGHLNVPHTLTVTDNLTWQGGGWLDGPGTTIIPADATGNILRVGNNAGYVGPDHTLEVYGSLTVDTGLGGGQGTSLRPGTVHVMPGGLLEMSGIGVIAGSAPSGGGLIINQGRFVLSGTDSDIYVQGATLQNEGVLEIAAGGELRFETTGIFRNGVGGVLSGPGSIVLSPSTQAEIHGGTLGGGLRIVNESGAFGSLTWVTEAGPITIEAGSEILNSVHPFNSLSLSNFVVANDQPLLGGGSFRNLGLLRKTAAGSSTWSVCYLEEGDGAFQPDPGTILFTGVCPP